MKKQPWLEIAEYVFLAGSVLGTFIAVTSSQVVYAAIPLTVALSLNLVNRRRFQQETQNYVSGVIGEAHTAFQSLHQQVQKFPALNLQLDTLNQKFNARPETDAIQRSETAIAQLSERLDALTLRLNHESTSSEVDLNGVGEVITDIYSQLNGLTSRLDNQPTYPEVDLSGVNQAIADINTQLNALTSHVEQVATPQDVDLSSVNQAIADINTQLNALTSHVEQVATPQDVDLSSVNQAIADINTQLNALTSYVEQVATPQDVDLSSVNQAIADINTQLNALTSHVEQVATPQDVDLSSVNQAIANINTQLNTLTLRLDQLSTPQSVDVSELGEGMAHLRGQLNALTLRVDHLHTPKEVDLSGVEQAIAHINGRLDTLNHEFHARLETPAIEQFEGAIPQLAEQLNALALRVDNAPTPTQVDLSGVEQAIADIRSQLNALTVRLDELPTPEAVNLSEAEYAIFDLNNQVEALTQQFNSRPETQTIEQLERAIPQLTEQLNAVTLHLDNTPTPQAVDLSGVEHAIADINTQLNALNQQFHERPETQVIEQSQGVIAQLTEQLNAVTLRLDNAPTPQAVDLTGFEQSITNINGRLDSLTQRLDHLPEPQDVDLSGVQHAIADINGQLNALNQQFQERRETQAIEQLERAMPQLTEQLNVMALRLDNSPAPTQVDLSSLEQAIADINDRLDSLNQQFYERPETQTVEHLETAIVQLAQQLDSSPTATPVDLSGLEQAIADINDRLDSLNQQFYERPETQTVEHLETAIVQLAQQLDSSPTATPVDLSGLEQAIADINGRLDTLNQQFYERPETQAVGHLETAIVQLAQQLDSSPTATPVDLSGLEQAIADINGRLDTLNQQFYERPETQAVGHLETAIVQLAQQLDSSPTATPVDLSGLEQAIADINGRLDTLNQQFYERPETQAVGHLETAIVQLAQQLDNSPTATPVDLSGLERAIADINSRLDSLNDQPLDVQADTPGIEQAEGAIQQLKEQLNVMTLHLDSLRTSSEVDLSEEQETLEDISCQVDAVAQHLNRLPDSSKINLNEVEETISGISFQLHALALHLDSLPASLAAVDLSQGEAAIADINNQLNVLNQQFNTPTETVGIEQLKGLIVHHKEQLSAMELRLDHLPNLSEDQLTEEKKEITNINFGLEALELFLDELPPDSDMDLTEVVIALTEINGQVDTFALHLENLASG
jgi:predicted  nucleic acid-binding Zn-ribbon protein